MAKGKLYIVATPIGNLSDITLRALEVLKSVSLILSEDTRETQKILSTHQIGVSQISYRDQNHDRVISRILQELDLGNNVALVSDSGTPLISDPGFKLVRDLSAIGYKVEAVPGPSSVIAALSVSGLPTDKFTFIGFLPRTPGARKNELLTYGSTSTTLVIFESPFRINKLLTEINEVLGNRVVCIVKDITKVFENVRTGRVGDILTEFENKKHKGEYVVLVAKQEYVYEPRN